jgi:pimeloyl-ACP methyl ester carboxylesterase
MLNYSRLIFIVLITSTLTPCNASLLGIVGNLLTAVINLLVPGGIEHVSENAKLCSLKTPGIIEYYGYTSETRNVTTEDGYILTVYCLFNSTARNSTLNPVIAWHGLMDASHTFVLNYPNQSLGFLLADMGYYVCLPNARGNGFSQGYVNNSRNANLLVSKYWQFSWDEIAEFDVPAVIDSVLQWTGKSKVIYVGHSQGSTIMFALLSSKPAYNEKISIFAALAPVAYLKHTESPLYVYASMIDYFLEFFYGGQFLPHTGLETLLEFLGCTLPTEALCENLLFYLFGYSSHIDEVSKLKE